MNMCTMVIVRVMIMAKYGDVDDDADDGSIRGGGLIDPKLPKTKKS